MENALGLTPQTTGLVNLDALTDTEKVRVGAAWNALAPNTRRSYTNALTKLSDWLATGGNRLLSVLSDSDTLSDLTDEMLAVYLSHRSRSGIKPGSLGIILAAVKWYFSHVQELKRDWLVASKSLHAIKRDSQYKPQQVNGLSWSDVDRVCAFAEMDGTVAGLRDASLIRLMSDCLLRISEAVAVNCGDLKGNTLVIQQSKTDQEGHGRALYVGDATLSLTQCYREKADISRGALFRRVRRGDHVQSTRLSINGARNAIKLWANIVGVQGFISGHSLRVGAAVSLAQAGASVVDMQVAGRWKSSQMPAHYAKAELAERGAVARFRYRKGVK